MAISLEQQNVLATDGDFIARIRQAAATVALEVLRENPALLGGGNAEYSPRASLARQVINNAPQAAQRAAYILATASPTVDPAAITDAQYLTFLRDNWSALAGYNSLYVPDVV